MSGSAIILCAIPGSHCELVEPCSHWLQPFQMGSSGFQSIGYSIHPNLTTKAEEDFVRAISQGPDANIGHNLGEYFGVAWEASAGTVKIFSDATGGFPVYAGWDGKVWWISTLLKAVALRLSQRKVDVRAALRWLTGERGDGTATILQNVLSVPAGMTLTLQRDGKSHLIKPDIAETPVVVEKSTVSDTIIHALKLVIGEWFPAETNRRVASDLTSGLDSSLVAWTAKKQGIHVSAFSMIEGQNDDDCRLSVVRAFAARHDLVGQQIVDVKSLTPFATDEDIHWGMDSSEALAWSALLSYSQTIASRGFALRLTGEGGDEILSKERQQNAERSSRSAFAQRHQQRLEQGLDTLLSPAGVRLAFAAGPEPFLPSSRFPPAAIQSRRAQFPIAWQSGACC